MADKKNNKTAKANSNNSGEKSLFQKLYENEIKAKLKETLGCKNVMEIPKLEKIVINMGVCDPDVKVVKAAAEDLALIAGQKPVFTKAKKSVAAFKLRENQIVGCKVTLRGKTMYEFLERLVNIALPRVRDFRGLSGKSFDGRGNYAFGLKEQIVFAEIDYDKIDSIRGMDIIISTSAKEDKEAKELLKCFYFPFYN